MHMFAIVIVSVLIRPSSLPNHICFNKLFWKDDGHHACVPPALHGEHTTFLKHHPELESSLENYN